jgi:hypothetical protein
VNVAVLQDIAFWTAPRIAQQEIAGRDALPALTPNTARQGSAAAHAVAHAVQHPVHDGLTPAIQPESPPADFAADGQPLPVGASGMPDRGIPDAPPSLAPAADAAATQIGAAGAPAPEGHPGVAVPAAPGIQVHSLNAVHAEPPRAARVGESGWDRPIGDRLVWMVSHREQVAELHLSPPELGPLQIVLTLNGNDQASAQFVSPHAPVREALEQALPRLQQMLADNGITLGNASVSADGFRESAQRDAQTGTVKPPGTRADSGEAPRPMQALRLVYGLVDTFA